MLTENSFPKCSRACGVISGINHVIVAVLPRRFKGHIHPVLVFYPCLQRLLKILLNNLIDGGEIHIFTAMDWIFVFDYLPIQLFFFSKPLSLLEISNSRSLHRIIQLGAFDHSTTFPVFPCTCSNLFKNMWREKKNSKQTYFKPKKLMRFYED